LLGSATLVAVTTTAVEVVTLGAVNIPLLEIVPAPADQVTAVFEVFVTFAENCCVPADAMLALSGETATVIAGPFPLLPPTVKYTVPSPRSKFGKSRTPTRRTKDPAVVGVPAMVPVAVLK